MRSLFAGTRSAAANLVLIAVLVAVVARMVVASGTPGPQFQVNTFTAATQGSPAVGMNAGGASVIAWASFGQDGDNFGIFAQRYNASGQPVGNEFQVNTITAGDQRGPSVGVDAAGNFVIVWSQSGSTADAIFARLFDSNGNPVATDFSPLGREFQVNSVSAATRFRSQPAVAMDENGNFAIVWAGTSTDEMSGGIFARLFEPNGAPVGRRAEFIVNSTTDEVQFEPTVAMNATGEFVVAWTSYSQDQPLSYGVFAQRFGPGGNRIGAEFPVNTITLQDQFQSDVSINSSGNVVIAWVSTSRGVLARGFGADGIALGDEFQVSTLPGTHRRPSVGLDATGGLVVTWDHTANDDDDTASIQARFFDASLAPEDVEFRVNEQHHDPINSALRLDGTGNFVVAWQDQSGADGEQGGIFARRFTSPAGALTLSIGDVRLLEGDSGFTDAVFTVNLSRAGVIAVDFFSSDGTAGAALTGADYQEVSGTLVFNPGSAGEMSQEIRVRINGDTSGEADETFFINLRNPVNATIVRGQGIGTILNDDNRLSIDDVAVTEGNSGTRQMTFTVSILPDVSDHPVSVQFATVSGTASALLDYVAQSGTVTLAPREASKEIQITINGDRLLEADETFSINLSNSANASLAKAVGVATIRNDDFASGAMGNQFLVNSTLSGFQFQTAVGMNTAGQSIVVWSSEIPGAGEGIFAQRFHSDGTRSGAQFRIDDTTGVCSFFPRRREPAVGMDADGDFVVVWTTAAFDISGTQFDENYAFSDVCAQRYREDGFRLGNNFQVDTNLNHTGHSQSPDIGMYGNGDFVIAWSAQGPRAGGRPRAIFAKRFDSNGTVVGSTNLTGVCNNAFTGAIEPCDILANSTTASGLHPSVAVNPSVPGCPVTVADCGVIAAGDFYIVWESIEIFARRFDGVFPSGSEFLVNTYTANQQERPVARMDEDGRMVVIWQGEGPLGRRGIFGQRFGPPAGGPLGGQFEVFAQEGSLGFVRSGLATNTQTGFVVAWNNLVNDASGNHAVFARFFGPDGIPQGDFFQVSDAGSSYFRPAAGMNSAGGILLAWEGGNDGSGFGIFARRLALQTLSINNVTVTEGDSGTTTASFTVSLLLASSQTVSVSFETGNGTATLPGNDYLAQSNPLVFHPGQPTTQQVNISVNGDTVPEPDEVFFVRLKNATNATISKAQGVGTIQNDDGADLSLIKTASPDPVDAGGELTYTIVVTNNGPNPATHVTLTDTLPASTMLVSSSASQGFCSGVSTVTCSLGTLDNAVQAAVQIVIRPTVGGLLTNTATVTGDGGDPNTANNGGRADSWVVCTTCPELEIAAVEVTQGVQFLGDPDQTAFPDNSVPLIQGKTTVVRVYFMTSAPVTSEGQFKNITGELSTFRCGETTPIRPVLVAGGLAPAAVRPTNSPQYPSGPDPSISGQRLHLRRTLNFLVPRGYTRPCIDLQVKIKSPDSSIVSTMRLGNLEFEEIPPTKVRLYNLQIPSTNEPREIDRILLPAWLLRGFPVSELIFEEAWYWLAFMQSCNVIDFDLTVVKWFNILGGEDSRYRYYAMWNDEAGPLTGCTIGGPVGSGPTGSPNRDNRLTWDQDPSYGDWLGAHELGHTFGRRHVNATGDEARPDPNYPYAGGTIGPPSGSLAGLDLRGRAQHNPAVIPSTWFDVMSYGMKPPDGRIPGVGQWVSDYTYKGLKDAFVRESGATAGSGVLGAPSEHLAVLGIVNITQGTAELDTVYRLPNMLPVQPRTAGSYTISLLDSSGNSLAQFPFIPYAIHEQQTVAGDELAAITELVPFHPSTARILVLKEGVSIAERVISPHPPAVTMISPLGGDVLGSGTVRVEWRASDDDGDALSFQVFFSPDGGRSWLLAASRLTTTQIDLAVDRMKGTQQGLFMVLASDGANTGFAVTPAPFEVPRHAPVAVISPQEDFAVSSGDVVILSGFGLDREDHLLDNEALEWTSSRDGLLGSGSTLMTGLLSPGAHLITLTATDSDGNRDSASIGISVVSSDATPPRITPNITGTFGNNGWYTSTVNVSWNVTDPESAVSSSSGCEVAIVSSDTSGITLTCTATSAGGTSSSSVIIKRDTTPPDVHCAAPDGHWHAMDVRPSCTASDSGSGLGNAADTSFVLSTNVLVGTETNSASTDSREVCDVAGNCANAGPITGNMVDKKPPSVVITAPLGTYLLHQPATASYSCTDDGSGTASCSGPVSNGAPVDTATVGTKTFAVNASDNVGNRSSRSIDYAVGYGIDLLYDSVFAKRSGSAYPIKVRLVDATGTTLSSSSVVLHAVSITRITNNTSGPLDDTGNANPDVDFRYDASLGGYIFNLSTKGITTGTYQLNFRVGADPILHAAPFAVR